MKVICSVVRKSPSQSCRLATKVRWSGVALAEFALVIPLLALILAATFDTGRALATYLILNNIAREGVRFGAQLSTMKAGCFSAYVDYDKGSQPLDASVGHYVVQGRLRFLLQTQAPWLKVSHPTRTDLNAEISSQFYQSFNLASLPPELAACRPTSTDQQNTYGVRLRAQYRSLFGFSITLNATSFGSYLFNSELFPMSGSTMLSKSWYGY